MNFTKTVSAGGSQERALTSLSPVRSGSKSRSLSPGERDALVPRTSSPNPEVVAVPKCSSTSQVLTVKHPWAHLSEFFLLKGPGLKGPDTLVFSCQICQKPVSGHKTSATNLTKHILCHHKNLEREYRKVKAAGPKRVPERFRLAQEGSSNKPSNPFERAKAARCFPSQDDVTLATTCLIMQAGLPLTFSRGVPYKNYLAVVAPGRKAPSYATIRKEMDLKHAALKVGGDFFP